MMHTIKSVSKIHLMSERYMHPKAVLFTPQGYFIFPKAVLFHIAVVYPQSIFKYSKSNEDEVATEADSDKSIPSSVELVSDFSFRRRIQDFSSVQITKYLHSI